MTLPIDDVWLTGDSVAAGVPSQRIHLAGPGAPSAVRTANAPVAHRNGGPDPRPTFDPTSFDPGPDLPPLPTLTPLPTFRPLSQWPAGTGEATPTPADPLPGNADEQADPRCEDGTSDLESPIVAPDADQTIRVTGLPGPGGGPSDISSGPVTPLATDEEASRITGNGEPIRRRRRAVEAPDAEAQTTDQHAVETDPARPVAPTVDSSARPEEVPRKVLVLGGSGVVGSAVARALAAQGARVAVHHASRAAEAGVLVDGLPGQGHLAVGADLSDSDDVAALIHFVAQSFDGLDVVINAASAGQSVARVSIVGSSLSEWTEAWTNTLTVDVLGAATVAHAAAAAFVAGGRGGRIILVAAKGRPFEDGRDSLRIATEQAVGALGSALAAELAPYGIGVTVVGSGSAAASGWSPGTLAETVAWLAAGPAASLPGAVFNIAG